MTKQARLEATTMLAALAFPSSALKRYQLSIAAMLLHIAAVSPHHMPLTKRADVALYSVQSQSQHAAWFYPQLSASWALLQ